MKVNKVAQWEGKLIWVDNPRSGKTKAGRDWKSVDFTLKYNDEQGYERHLTFNTFGAERVDKILSIPIDTTIRVAWNPVSREYNGKWFTKNDAYEINVPETNDAEQKSSAPVQQNTAPLFRPNHYDGEDIPF